VGRLNNRKRIAHLNRAIANKKQQRARLEEIEALIQEFYSFHDLSDDEMHKKAPYILSLLSRIERLAKESGHSTPEFEAYIREIRDERNSIKADEAEMVRALKMFINKQVQLRAEQVVPTGTVCSVCRHRPAQTQAYGVWLCKRCARGLDELPKGRQ